MKIERRDNGGARGRGVRDELGDILRSGADGRPVCAPDCPDASPARCSRHCPHIPVRMSSDPENHPLEAGIAPLVYELKRLAAFHPCWSCEGHDDAQGRLWKIPRVWFYCDSVVHLRVLANAAAYLQAVKEGAGEHAFKQLYPLFGEEDVGPLIGAVMVELGWRAPAGVGEVALIDNRTVLHASYYARPARKGYPISVRYLF